jgi:hypothetical protein
MNSRNNHKSITSVNLKNDEILFRIDVLPKIIKLFSHYLSSNPIFKQTCNHVI